MDRYTFPPAMTYEPIPGRRYFLLAEQNTGAFLCSKRADGSSGSSACSSLLTTADRPGDEGLWEKTSAGFVNAAAADLVLKSPAGGGWHVVERCVSLALPGGELVAADGSAAGGAAPAVEWDVVRGPDRLISKHLAQLRSDGYAVLPALMPANVMTAIKATIAEHLPDGAADETEGGRYNISDILVHSLEVSRTMANPVLLRLIGDYLGVTELHCATLPWAAVAKPNPVENPVAPTGGWHSECVQPSTPPALYFAPRYSS